MTAHAQLKRAGNHNFWNYKSKPFYFGMTLGIHSSGYLTQKSRQFNQSDSLNFVSGLDRPGLNVNFITNLKIGQYFDFRFIPGFAYSERRIQFKNNNEIFREVRIESFFVEAPILLRFKSAPYKDKRLFVVGGLKYSFDVGNNSRARADVLRDLFTFAPHDFQFEVGAGIQMFFPFFIFSPEIKFSHGIGNIHVLNNNKEESRVLGSILSRALTISFHIEG